MFWKNKSRPTSYNQSGFTIIEIMVVLGILALLFALSTVNLGHAQSSVSLSTATDTLVADLKNQQILSMDGDKGSSANQMPHGVYFESNGYVLFANPSYNGSDPSNFSVNLASISLTTTLVNSQVLFNLGDGEVNNFLNGSNRITLSSNSDSKTITLNRFGVISKN